MRQLKQKYHRFLLEMNTRLTGFFCFCFWYEQCLNDRTNPYEYECVSCERELRIVSMAHTPSYVFFFFDSYNFDSWKRSRQVTHTFDKTRQDEIVLAKENNLRMFLGTSWRVHHSLLYSSVCCRFTCDAAKSSCDFDAFRWIFRSFYRTHTAQ